MFGKTRKQLQAEIDQLKADWAEDQAISKQLIDYRTEECKQLSARCAVLEASLADTEALLSAIATAIANNDPDYVVAAQPCSMDCVMKVNMGPNADHDVWHHPDCPNHTTACCTINEDPELKALIDQEEELRKDATITVFELARELGLTNAEVVKTCQDCGIAVKSHTSKLTKREADVVRFQYMEV